MYFFSKSSINLYILSADLFLRLNKMLKIVKPKNNNIITALKSIIELKAI